MQDIREIVDQTQILRYILRFEPLLCIPVFIQKNFHYVHIGPPTLRNSTEEFVITRLGVHNSSLQQYHLYTRGKAQN